MSDTKISALPVGSSPDGTEAYPAVQGGVTVQLTGKQLACSGAPLTTLVDAATVTPDFSTGPNFSWTLGATGRTLANPTNAKPGTEGRIYIVQDGTGSRTITTYGTAYKFPGGSHPTLTTAANAVDYVRYFVRDSSHIDLMFNANLS